MDRLFKVLCLCLITLMTIPTAADAGNKGNKKSSKVNWEPVRSYADYTDSGEGV